jgi:hypothetical protein
MTISPNSISNDSPQQQSKTAIMTRISSVVDSVALDETAIVERFDQLVKDGVIFYDPNPKVIPYEDGGYKVSPKRPNTLPSI